MGRVTKIMGDISAASVEQSKGIEHVGVAVSQMDTVTQQNAALVEEPTAAAPSLASQATTLKQAVSMFGGHVIAERRDGPVLTAL